MKKIFVAIFLVSCFNNSYSQANLILGKTVEATRDLKVTGKIVNRISNDTTSGSLDSSALITEYAAKKFALNNGGGGGNGTTPIVMPIGPFTTLPKLAFNPDTTDLVTWIKRTFYGNNPPITTLTGGTLLENSGTSNSPITLNWSVQRTTSTDSITTIVVGETTKSFTQPASGATVSGTQTVAVPSNVTTTYWNVATTKDNLKDSSSTTFTFQSKMYIGYVATNTPTNNEIMAATGWNVGGNFATTRARTGTLANPSAQSYIVVAYPASMGAGQIKINGLLVSYASTTRILINASSYSSSYNIYISPFPTNGGVDFQIL